MGVPFSPVGERIVPNDTLPTIMDPLSVAASVIAVIGAANTAVKSIEKAISLRHAPSEIHALVNEVEDLRALLEDIDSSDISPPKGSLPLLPV
jgi:hypothetical protein